MYSDDFQNLDSDDSDDSDDSGEKIPLKRIPMKKIKCLNIFLEKTSCLISNTPKMSVMQRELFQRNF